MTPPDLAGLSGRYRVACGFPLYLLGLFDRRVTVLTQQNRALNLAWALIEAGLVPTEADGHSTPLRIGIVGGGFAGLTFAAALIQKRCRCKITLFEERDTLLPLQQGSDTRWLHPRIYDWPDEGSEAASAMLPVLNWTAARASDVVVQALTGWDAVVDAGDRKPEVFCNTRHLQVSSGPTDGTARIEWIGERRDPRTGSTHRDEPHAKGLSREFDLVVLAIGFGVEINNTESYWRNETLGQPSLHHPRRTYLVSGQGDGAMIDLLRLTISQYRQDRILEELFEGKGELLAALKALRGEFLATDKDFPLFQRFEELRLAPAPVGDQFELVLRELAPRLRRDTEVILRLRVRNLSDLLSPETSRTSFQNALLVHLLYLCGGFTPTTDAEKTVIKRFGIPPEQVVCRHGTARADQLRRVLSQPLCKAVGIGDDDKLPPMFQLPDGLWPGGYFGFPGRTADTAGLPDADRATWRKEYLPGPTSLFAAALCGALAGTVGRLKPDVANLRITLHRSLLIGSEQLLQQACEYTGRGIAKARSTSGRTFPATNATIGLAYSCRRIVRSTKGVEPAELQRAMASLHLDQASRSMSGTVGFVLAIPILQPYDGFHGPSPVVGVAYVDSSDDGFWLADEEVAMLAKVIEEAVRAVENSSAAPFDRVRNYGLRDLEHGATAASGPPAEVAGVLELSSVETPTTTRPFLLNFDHSDLTPLTTTPDGTKAPSATGGTQ